MLGIPLPSLVEHGLGGACSAWRLLGPVPLAGSCALDLTSEVKLGACCGPARFTSLYSGRSGPSDCAHSCSAVLGSARTAVAAVHLIAPERADDVARLLEAGIEIERAEQRLAGIRQDIALGAPARALLADAHDELRPQAELVGDGGTGLAPDEPVEAAREIAFGGVAETARR